MEFQLPPGFRFFPTDEELITCYLATKVMDASFTTAAIRDVDLYESEPWDLPCEQRAVAAGGGSEDLQEGYFFCTKGSKYPSGVRARRATRLGYWKSTGKDKAVHSRAAAAAGGRLVGTRKTLVFYRGRAPRGEKTGWVMHEYAMGDRSSSALLRGAQSQWVICKVFMRKHPMSDSKLETEGAVDGGEHREAAPTITRIQPGEADYYLPELLDYDGCNDLPNAGDLDGCDDISSVIGPLHLDGLCWNFGS